jgi:hypothetical protein
MSVGMQLIRSIVESRSRAGMRAIAPELFVNDELPAYEYLTQHYRRFGEIPSMQAMADHGIQLAGFHLEDNLD